MFDTALLTFQHVWSLYSGQMPVMLTFAALFTIFAVFDSQASTPGKYWWRNPGLPTDIAYFFVHTLIGSYFRLPVLVLVVFVLSRTMTTAEINDYFTNGRGLFADLPFWAQVVVYLLLTDFLLYWIHRGFHRNLMWKFHAIHHSSKQVDWTTAIRFHPINLMLQSSFVMGLMLSLGIKPEVIALVAPFDAFLAVWQHSNTKWKLGPLKYVLATPVFHRWHHTLPEEGGDMNFAPTFAFWDLAFGTFYMPEGKLPQTFGVEDPELGEGYIAQFLYPFRGLLPVSASPQAHKPEPPVR